MTNEVLRRALTLACEELAAENNAHWYQDAPPPSADELRAEFIEQATAECPETEAPGFVVEGLTAEDACVIENCTFTNSIPAELLLPAEERFRKLREDFKIGKELRYFDVVDYGATMNGVTDDWEAIKAAMKAAEDWIAYDESKVAVVVSSKPGEARVSHSVGVPWNAIFEGFTWRRDP
ncbi:MAG: hypothetical protein V4529_16620 [Gemmatimonadota bacterium]